MQLNALDEQFVSLEEQDSVSLDIQQLRSSGERGLCYHPSGRIEDIPALRGTLRDASTPNPYFTIGSDPEVMEQRMGLALGHLLRQGVNPTSEVLVRVGSESPLHEPVEVSSLHRGRIYLNRHDVTQTAISIVHPNPKGIVGSHGQMIASASYSKASTKGDGTGSTLQAGSLVTR